MKFDFNINNLLRLTAVIVVMVAGMAMFSDTFDIIPSSDYSTAAPPVYRGADTPMKRVMEAHWQGMEAVPLTWELAAKLGIPLNEKGVLIDEVTLAAADSGLLAKDVIKSINGVKVADLEEFYTITKRLKNQRRASIEVERGKNSMTIDLIVSDELGFAQLESAPMVMSGSISPHRYRGACTDCHAIGSVGQLNPDPDNIVLTPPPISKKTKSPHRYRGKCKLCHVVR